MIIRNLERRTFHLCRREFLRRMGLAGVGLVIGRTATLEAGPATVDKRARRGMGPGESAGAWTRLACRHRYLEFSEQAGKVEWLAAGFGSVAWRIRIGGLVERERDITLEELLRNMPVEARPCGPSSGDAMPNSQWIGFPLSTLVRWARPQTAVRFLQVASFVRPDLAPNQARPSRYPWPYREALALEEALDPRAFVATGLDGHDLPPHRGAPLRLVLPWKRGSKSVKAITRFEFTERQPRTFWGDVTPHEYDFNS